MGPPILESINELRRFQRHKLLREFGEDGQVLPENLKVAAALDMVIRVAAKAANVPAHGGPPGPSSPPTHHPIA